MAIRVGILTSGGDCPGLNAVSYTHLMPKPMGKYKRLEVFYLSKPVYTADKPSDCHYCYFWTNGRKGCRLGRNNCYYLISLPPKPKSECDGCPYGRNHPCIGWCTKKVTSAWFDGSAPDSGLVLPLPLCYNGAKFSRFRSGGALG